jgi:hypothetical protein
VATPEDKKFTLSNKTLVQQFKMLYLDTVKMAGKKARFFYNGREMLDNYEIGSFSFMSGQVIQAMIS